MRGQASMETVADVASHPPKIRVGIQDNPGVEMPRTRRDILTEFDTWVFTHIGHWIIL